MTPVPAIWRVVGVITDNWHAANPTGWRLTLDAVDVRGGRLAEVIRDRYLALRDEVARAAFDERRDVCVIAWERAQTMAAERRNSRVGEVGAGKCAESVTTPRAIHASNRNSLS
jgi:hypothetical protein